MIIGALGLLLTQCVRFPTIPLFPADATAVTPAITPPGIDANQIEGAQIDVSEDDKALGYPDQRKVVSDRRGRLFVAYRKQARVDGLLHHHIFVARSDDGGKVWTVTNGGAPVEQTGPYMQRVPALAISGQGVLHLVWYGADRDNAGSNQRQIKYTRSTDGGDTWSTWRNIAEIPGYAEPQRLWQEHPVVVVRDSAVFVFWQGRDAETPKRSQIRFTISRDGGLTWSAQAIVRPQEPGGHSRPAVLVSRDGLRLSVLAYGENDGKQRVAMSQSSDGGASWSPWADISPSDNDQRHVSAALDSRGTVHAAWREGSLQTRTFIRYATFGSRGWSAPLVIDNQSNQFQFFPSLAITSDDRLVLAWIETHAAAGFPEEEFRAGVLRWVTTRLPSDNWTVPETLTLDEPVNFVSMTASDVSPGRVDVVWSQPVADKETRLKYGPLLLR